MLLHCHSSAHKSSEKCPQQLFLALKINMLGVPMSGTKKNNKAEVLRNLISNSPKHTADISIFYVENLVVYALIF